MRAVIIVLLAALATSSALAQLPSAGFDPKRDAAKDIAKAVVAATKQDKRILLDVGGNW